jgi:hypothetical protein
LTIAQPQAKPSIANEIIDYVNNQDVYKKAYIGKLSNGKFYNQVPKSFDMYIISKKLSSNNNNNNNKNFYGVTESEFNIQ